MWSDLKNSIVILKRNTKSKVNGLKLKYKIVKSNHFFYFVSYYGEFNNEILVCFHHLVLS